METHTKFVILHHQFSPEHERTNHWDLMLESDGHLKTWALSEPLPPVDSQETAGTESQRAISAVQLDDHRLDYLTLEGPISGDRGSVTQVLAGTYRWVSDTANPVAILESESNQWRVEFQNSKQGCMLIVS